MKSRILKIALNTIPILVMILLISFIKNDYLITSFYIIIILISLLIKYEKKDFLFLIFGFIAMTISEYIFITTGVETFNRNSLFGIMPIWLPFLWAYIFMVIKRAINILQR